MEKIKNNLQKVVVLGHYRTSVHNTYQQLRRFVKLMPNPSSHSRFTPIRINSSFKTITAAALI